MPEWNIPSRNLGFVKIRGYKIEYKIDDVFNNPPPLDNGMCSFTSMRREDCKWLTMKPPTIEFAPEERMNRLPPIELMNIMTPATLH